MMPQHLDNSFHVDTDNIHPVPLIGSLWWLHSSHTPGTPISDFLLRVVFCSKAGYRQGSLPSPSLHGRLTNLLVQLQLYEGESVQSFVTGAAHQMTAAGITFAATLQQQQQQMVKILDHCLLVDSRLSHGQ